MSHRYRAFGLEIESSFAVPELLKGSERKSADLQLREASLPTGPDHYHLEVEGDVATLWAPDARAAYRMIGGRELLVDSRSGEIDRGVRLYLLGSAMAAVLHQRGLLPLHACALEFNERAVAFLGRSGAGKSTLAAWLVDRGGRLLSDDVCVVREGEKGFVAAAGIPRLRLWRDALEARGESASDYPRSFEDWDKFDLPSTAVTLADEVDLVGVFLLDDARKPLLTALSGSHAVEALAANTYRGSYVQRMGRAASHFRQCISLAQSVPMERFSRPRGYARMDQDHALLLDKVRQLTG